jgi:large subunit ribosomal protein L18
VGSINKLKKSKASRMARVRYKLRKVSLAGARARVCVFRSLKHIHAHIVDDSSGKVLCGCSSVSSKIDKNGDKKAVAKSVGIELGKIAKEKGIDKICFDRGRHLYHGRVKSLADGIREQGIAF